MIDDLCVEYPVAETALVAEMEAVLMHWPFHGYRCLTVQLRREGVVAGERVVCRLLRQLHTSRSVGRLHITTTDSRYSYRRYPNLIRYLPIVHPDQV
jgi:hypothetical protein